MSNLDVDALKELAGRATEAGGSDWSFVMCDDDRPMIATAGDVVCLADPNHGVDAGLPDKMDTANFAFIAATNPAAVLSLIAEIERLREALAAAEPFVELVHSTTQAKDTRAFVLRVLKQVRAALSTPPADKEG